MAAVRDNSGTRPGRGAGDNVRRPIDHEAKACFPRGNPLWKGSGITFPKSL